MKINTNAIIRVFKSYFVPVLLFIFVGCLFKTIETSLFYKYQDSISFFAITRSFFNIISVFCLYSIIIFPVYFLIGIFNKKIAHIFGSLLFSILILLEAGLFMYYKQTGVLMGAESIVRSVSEILATIRNSSNMAVNFILIISALMYFLLLPFFLKKIKIFSNIRFIKVGFMVVVALSVCITFYQKDKERTVNCFLQSKSFYFFSEIRDYRHYNDEKIEKNQELLERYAEIYSHRTIPDLNYPMERPSSEIPDVLSPYFNKAEKQPTVVVVIVESLGSYIMGDKGNNTTFTPFLDSLANVGLYWKNCLSLTGRTFGVVPSVIGSVPHGMIGFQFGKMPKHYSLFSILKDNNYSTNFFHGGDTNFDSMLDFLTLQKPDHIDNFMPQLWDYQQSDKANYWALYDHVLFNKNFEYLQTLPPQKPKVNVYLTLTTHEPFYGSDKELKKIYEPRVEEIFSKLDAEHYKNLLPVKNILTPFTYLDDCMRDFFNNYSKQPDFENTIFVITGDHSFGYHKNNLAHHSVPLIIWSPLLKTSKVFQNIVSHFSITPSIISFLQNNYNIKTPENLSWCSDGLDTTSVFKPSEKLVLLNYIRQVNEMIYNQYYFNNSNKELFEINENLDLKPINDSQILEFISSEFQTLKYVNNYVYHNDKLVKSNNQSDDRYQLIKSYKFSDVIVCKTPDTIPSIHGIDTFFVMPAQKIANKHDKIKIRLEIDLVINDNLWIDCYMMLNFICLGNDFKYISRENITKYVVTEGFENGANYKLSIEKEINVSDAKNLFAQICITTNEKDDCWRPDKKISFSNTKVLISGK